MNYDVLNKKFLNRVLVQILIAAALMISILAVYYQVNDFEFIYYDDPKYVRDNVMVGQGITIESIRWSFSSIGYASNWHPITWLSHIIDVELYGLNPGMHHMTNVFFHIANTLLLFFIFFRITGEIWKCTAVAALFALHPLHVESVAWIAERKDVLSTFFMMLTVLSYTWYVKRRGVCRYFTIMILYTLGLMAKPMLVTLPFVLLLLDFWPIRRPELLKPKSDVSFQGIKDTTCFYWKGFKPLLWEKSPLFVLAGISSWITYLAQNRGGSVSSLDILPVGSRIANAIIAYCEYLWKIFWPFDLAVFYPYSNTFNLLMIAGSALLLIFVTAFVLKLSRQFPFLIVGWLWYLGTLVPVIGIVQVGYQSMADRYTYIPLIGISLMLVWGISSVFTRLRKGKYILTSLFIMLIPGLVWLSWLQTGYWKDSFRLFSHAIDVTRNNYLAHTNLAVALFEKGDVQSAVHHSNEALKIKPDYVPARCNLGLGFKMQGRYYEAIDQFRQSLRIDPGYINARCNLGSALYALGSYDEAMLEFQKVLHINPQHAGAIEGIRLARIKKREVDNTIDKLNKILGVQPNSYTHQYRLAELYRMKGKSKEAMDHYEKALLINPDLAEAIHNVAILYAANKEFESALHLLQKIVNLNPDNPDVYYNIACIYSRQGKVEDALTMLTEAINKGFHNQDALRTDMDLDNIRQTEYFKKLLQERNDE